MMLVRTETGVGGDRLQQSGTNEEKRPPRRATGVLVCNKTNKQLTIRAPDDPLLELTLAPLERGRRITEQELHKLELDRYAKQGYLGFENEPDVTLSHQAALLGAMRWWFLIIFPVVGLIGNLDETYWLTSVGLLLALFFFSLIVQLKRSADSSLRPVVGWIKQQISLLLVLAIGVLLPSAMLLFPTGLWGRLDHALRTNQMSELALHFELACRLLHLLFIVVLSLLPALLFFAFDRDHVATLRDKFTRQIFRFDSQVHTTGDIQARYGHLLNDAYGSEAGSNVERLLPARHSPLFVATLMITMGWTLTILSVDAPSLPPNPPVVGQTVDDSLRYMLASIFSPRRSVVTFGFLGAYFYALHTAFRSYIRRDLRPKSYSHITVRIVTVMILSWVLSLLAQGDDGASSPWLLGLVFVTGIVPETGLVVIYDFVYKLARKFQVKMLRGTSLVDEHEPLTHLDGIDLYDRARLLDEGVTNVEALAHHDIVELTLMTRIPVPRLLDWLDQAILHLRLEDDGRSKTLRKLRSYGIRTATDLVKACGDERKRAALERVFASTQRGSHSASSKPEQEEASRLDIIRQSIGDEEWIQELLQWHKRQKLEVLCLPQDAESGSSAARLGEVPALHSPQMLREEAESAAN